MTAHQTKLLMMAILKGADMIATAIDQHRCDAIDNYSDRGIERITRDLIVANVEAQADADSS